MTDSELLEAAKEFYFKRYPRRHRSEWQMPQDMADFALQAVRNERKAIAERLDHVCICSDPSHMTSELLKVQEALRND